MTNETGNGGNSHKTYTTVSGDMWDQIAYDQLGDEAYRSKLMELNPEHVETYVFSAGIVLRLPEPEPETGIGLPPWKAQG